jgi:hypothetical protein
VVVQWYYQVEVVTAIGPQQHVGDHEELWQYNVAAS